MRGTQVKRLRKVTARLVEERPLPKGKTFQGLFRRIKENFMLCKRTDLV